MLTAEQAHAERYDVRHGDALRLLLELEDASVDGVFTDCPYSSGGMMRADRSATAHQKYVNSDSPMKNLGAFEGDSRDQRAFGYWCALWYAECWRVTKPGGVLCTFTDWRQLPTTTDAVQAGGWVWRGLVPWDKTEAARPQKGRPRAQCEYIVFATRGAHEPWDGAPCLPGFFTCSAPRDRHHITEKPIALMTELVQLVPPGARVLDPFSGSGTTAAACIRTGRYPIAFEIVEANARLVVERCEAECRMLTLEAARSGQVALFGAA